MSDAALVLVTDLQEVKRLREEAELRETRLRVREESLDHTRARFLSDGATVEAAQRCFEEALINLDEDEFDDFETAAKKAEKLDRIERELDRAIATWENSLNRCGYEVAQAQKALS